MFVAFVDEASFSEIADVHDVVEKISHQELSNKYEALLMKHVLPCWKILSSPKKC